MHNTKHIVIPCWHDKISSVRNVFCQSQKWKCHSFTSENIRKHKICFLYLQMCW